MQQAIDSNNDTFLSTGEIIAVVHDLYNDIGAGDSFDFYGAGGKYSAGDVADALALMNNMPHLDSGDFT